MASYEITVETLMEQVRTVEGYARRLGKLEQGEELCLVEPRFQGYTQISGWQVYARPKVRSGEGPLTRPSFIVDGGSLGSTADSAYEQLRATLVPLGVGASRVVELQRELEQLRGRGAAGE